MMMETEAGADRFCKTMQRMFLEPLSLSCRQEKSHFVRARRKFFQEVS